jgi:hypothetical protein
LIHLVVAEDPGKNQWMVSSVADIILNQIMMPTTKTDHRSTPRRQKPLSEANHESQHPRVTSLHLPF